MSWATRASPYRSGGRCEVRRCRGSESAKRAIPALFLSRPQSGRSRYLDTSVARLRSAPLSVLSPGRRKREKEEQDTNECCEEEMVREELHVDDLSVLPQAVQGGAGRGGGGGGGGRG